MGAKPAVSIIMPAYNVASSISLTIESILRQSYVGWTLCIVDDGSTDDTREIIQEYVNRFANIKCLTIDNTGSARIPRLTALGLTNSEWVCNVDADDVLECDYLERLLHRAEETQADIVTPLMEYVDSEKNVYQTVPPSSFDFSTVLSGKDAAMLTFSHGTGSWIACNGMLCKRSLYEKMIASSDMTLKYVYQDEVDFLKILLLADHVAFERASYYYFRNPVSVTHRVSVKSYDKLVTEVSYRDLVRDNYSSEIAYLMEKRLFDTVIRRRIKYEKERSYFNVHERFSIESMFRYAFSNLNRHVWYGLWKQLLLVSYGCFSLAVKLVNITKNVCQR